MEYYLLIAVPLGVAFNKYNGLYAKLQKYNQFRVLTTCGQMKDYLLVTASLPVESITSFGSFGGVLTTE
jgi:hypothetical protein